MGVCGQLHVQGNRRGLQHEMLGTNDIEVQGFSGNCYDLEAVLFSSTKTKTKSVRRLPFFTGDN